MRDWKTQKLVAFWGLSAMAAAGVLLIGAGALRDHEVGEMAALVLIGCLLATAATFSARVTSQADRVSAEEARRRQLMDQASDAFLVSDLDGRFVEVNAEACRLTGYSAAQLIGMTIHDLTSSTELPALKERIKKVRTGGIQRFERCLLRADGSEVEIEVTTSAVADRIIAVARDITEKREIERALKQREELFRVVSEMTSDYAYSLYVDPDGSLSPEWVTDGFEEVTGYSVKEAEGLDPWLQMIHPDDAPRVASDFASFIAEGGTRSSEFRVITKSGDVRRLASWTRAVKDDGGRITRLIGAVSDVTNTRKLEDELARSQARYKELYDTIPVGIYTRRWDGTGIGANPAAVEMFGYPDAEAFLNQSPEEFYVSPEDRQRFLAQLERDDVLMDYDVQLKKADGTPMWVRNTSHLVRDSDGAPLYYDGACIDITEQKQLEQELRRALTTVSKADAERRRLVEHLVRAKEEERRRVASDIHDDSVQVMTSVAISLERLVKRSGGDGLKKDLETVEDSVRAAVRRLRSMVFELRPPSLDEEGLIAALTLYLEEMQIETGIHYEIDNGLDEEPPTPSRVALYRIAQEALVNVRKHSGAKNVRIALEPEGGGVMLSVEDDGQGFDPVQITPSPGHIGLAEMRERAELAEGRLRIARRDEGGTLVEVWLPNPKVVA